MFLESITPVMLFRYIFCDFKGLFKIIPVYAKYFSKRLQFNDTGFKNIEDMNYEYLFYDGPGKKSPFIDERIFGALSSAAVIIFSGSHEFKRRIFIQHDCSAI